MSEADRQRWNERYAARPPGEPSDGPVPRLIEVEALIRPTGPPAHTAATGVSGQAERTGPAELARALDLACGAGRNALYLAKLGYLVDAWDISDVALDLLVRAARREGVTARIHPRRVDLDWALLPEATYDLIVDTYFLDRRLFEPMAAALRPGGLLFIETLLSTPERPGRPDYYLQPGELPKAFRSLQPLLWREHRQEGWAALLARKP